MYSIALLSRPEGAIAEEPLATTYQQPHTLRGFFSHQVRGVRGRCDDI